jgi:hypothetical protein
MRVETNEKLVKRNRQFAQGLFFASLAILIGGFILTNQPLFNPNQPMDESLLYLVPSVILPIGLVMTLASVRMTNLWIKQPRPEIVIREGLKGVSNKSVLYNYYHFPARHVLICPQGVFAIVTRFQDGGHKVEGDKWSSRKSFMGRLLTIMRLDGIGNPTQDAIEAAKHVQKLIDPIMPDVQVQPLIIFIDPRVQLEINDPTVPVLYPSEKQEPNLKDYLRSSKEKRKVNTNPQLLALQQAFEEATLPKEAKVKLKADPTAQPPSL